MPDKGGSACGPVLARARECVPPRRRGLRYWKSAGPRSSDCRNLGSSCLHASVHVSNCQRFEPRLLVSDEHGIRVSIIRMIAVHPCGHPLRTVEIASREYTLRMQKENDLAEAAIGKKHPKTTKFLLRQYATGQTEIQACYNFATSLVREKPEADHRRIVNR